MTKESLMAMGLSEEQAKQVLAGLDGSYVPKSRFDEQAEELKAAKGAVRERDGQLESLRKSSGDNAALQQQIADLQKANADQQAAHAGELRQLKLDNAVDRALAQAHAINPATVKPLLAAFLEKAEPEADGMVRGLADEIAKLAKAEGTGFLFRTEPATPTISGAAPASGVTAQPDPKAAGYEARLADARKAGNAALAVAVKREAAADGVQLF